MSAFLLNIPPYIRFSSLFILFPSMHTILGANGTIALGIARELAAHNLPLRLVSRTPRAVNAGDILHSADIMKRESVFVAVKDSEVVYLTAGFRYNSRVWRETWPVVMRNVLDACHEAKAKLVFFDNVYMYGKVSGWMTEGTPMNPCSQKGEVRARIAQMLLDDVKSGNVQALIARAADFYGPETPNSFFNEMVLKNLHKGKKAQVLASANKLHTYTYTHDAGKATALLGMTQSAYNQVWHLPTDRNAMTGAEFVRLAGEVLGREVGSMVMTKWMMQALGLFIEPLKESVEMLYQSEYDYLFDSSKFEKAFSFQPMPYKQGFAETFKAL